MSSEPLQILVLSTFDGSNANVISDYLFSFNAFSRHRYFYIFDCRKIDEAFRFDRFDVILVFWSLYLPGGDLSPRAMDAIATAKARKVLFLQDEYRDVRPINRLMARLGITDMFTCVAPSQHELFYPRSIIPTLETVHTVLTGYVPSYLQSERIRRNGHRPIDVGYRSRNLPMYLGDLGQEKRIIGERFQAFGDRSDLRMDISSREEDRIYGKNWVNFIRSCRVSLGTPSGASVVDLAGDVRRNCEAYLRDHPAVSYDEIRNRFFADVDGKVTIETISPRVFEAAALGSTLCLLEGDYAGIVEPDVHFIRIARDYSNLEEVAEQIRDVDLCTRMAQRAHADLIGSGQYSYRAFVRRFDSIIDTLMDIPVQTRRLSQMRFCASRYSKSDRWRIIPFGARFLRLPSLSKLPSLTSFGSPQLPLTKMRMGIQFCLKRPRTRQHLKRALLGRDDARPANLLRLIKDAYRLSIIIRANQGEVWSQADFHVQVVYFPKQSRLQFLSVPVGNESSSLPDEDRVIVTDAQELAQLATSGAIRQILWDHAGIGSSVFLRLGSRKLISIYFDSSGTYRFSAIEKLVELQPQVMAEMIGAVLELTENRLAVERTQVAALR